MTVETSVNSHIWEKGVSKLACELDPQIFSAYIKPLVFSSYNCSNCELEVVAPSSFVRNQVDKNFREKISRVLSSEIGSSDVNLKFVVASQANTDSPIVRSGQHVVVKKVRPAQKTHESPSGFSGFTQISNANDSSPFPSCLNPRYTFSTFVVGNSNQFCHAAAMRVAENPGKAYNPLFIYGGVGLGKTHLLHAIGNAALECNPKTKVVYMSSETFTNYLIQALRNSRMDAFKQKMRSVELLLIDDIQFMAGKERTQEEFFHTFNTLYNAKHQIVITSDKLPQETPQIEERLQTRFSWGLTADIQAPDFETRAAILRRKAVSEGFDLPDDVAGVIAERICSNVRELEGALTRLHAVSSLQGKSINLEMAMTALKPLLQPRAVNISVDDIKKAVAEQFSIKVSDIISKRRTQNLTFPRHIAMYLCRKHTTCSYPEIGQAFGGRDHSSVIHASSVVSAKISSNMQIKDMVGQIEKRLLSY